MNSELIDKIFNENCLEGMKRIPDASVDMILCDLPYGCLHKDNPNAQWDSIIPFEPLWTQYERVIKDDGAIVLFSQGLFTAKLILSNEKLFRYTLVWDKGRATGFLNARRMPMRCHEDICVFYKSLPTYNPQMEKCLPHQRNHSRGKQEGKQTNRCYGVFGKADDFISDEKYPRSIISIQKEHESTTLHPTQKPVDLIRYLIRTYTNKGDLVLDNCLGSGTTAIAAVREKRHFLGFELEKEYYDIATKRIRDERQQLTLDFDV